MKRFTKILGLYGVVCLVAFPAMGHAQSSDVLNRLSRIENELDTLNRAMYRGERPPPVLSEGGGVPSADTEVRLQQMEREMREMRGQIEEQNYQLRTLSKQLEAASSAPVKQESASMGESSGVPVSSSEPIFVAPDEPSTPARSLTGDIVEEPALPKRTLGTLTQDSDGNVSAGTTSAAAQYEHAYSMLKSGNTSGAEKEFRSFLVSYPDHELVPNAQYWLGETYYVRGEHERAARLFAEGYQKHPKGPKAPDNLLKLGMSLAGMGNTEDACVALAQLSTDAFDGAANVRRLAEQEMNKIGCQ